MKAKQREAASGDCLSLSGKLTLSLLWCCQTSKSVLSHKHTQTDTRWNFGWATTAGNRHRAELSCHVEQQHTPYMKMGTQQKCINPYSRTHTHTHVQARLDPWDVESRLIFFMCGPFIVAQFCAISFGLLSEADEATTSWIPPLSSPFKWERNATQTGCC